MGSASTEPEQLIDEVLEGSESLAIAEEVFVCLMEPKHIAGVCEVENKSFAVPWTERMFYDELKNILQTKPLLFAVNILLTCISLTISLLFAEALCDATVEAFRDSRFAGYLNTITPKMFLFVFLLFFFDGFFGILRLHHAAERTVFLQNTKHEVGIVCETVKIILSAEFLVEMAIFAISCSVTCEV